LGSDSEMLSALVELATSPEALARLRTGASAGIPAANTWDTLLDRHLEIYRELMEPTPVSYTP